ncbi:hypothetical protein SAMN05428972_0443 [Rhodanobacter sp. OK091]|nr:hypothetical protein SAMN05428972_0443 [Rhodanobacter sp. OK091]
MMKDRQKTEQRLGVIRCSWLLGLLLLMLGGCEDKNEFLLHSSPEYLAQFGVVKGQTNDIEVAGVLFRIPPQYSIDVTSQPPIRKGHADSIFFTLDFSQALKGIGPVVPGQDPHVPLTDPERHGRHDEGDRSGIRVEISHYNGETGRFDKSARVPGKDANKVQWIPGRDANKVLSFPRRDAYLEALGLRLRYGGGYESVHEKTPIIGNPVSFYCVSSETCVSRIEYPKGIIITIDIEREMLPHWKLVYENLLQVVRSLVVDKRQ